MDSVAADFEPFGDAVIFITHFMGMPNLRQPGKVAYPLKEVRLQYLLTVLRRDGGCTLPTRRSGPPGARPEPPDATH